MQHLGQGLGVHQAMLNRNLQKKVQRKFLGSKHFARHSAFQAFIQSTTQTRHVVAYFGNRRPILWEIRGQPATNGVNAECKQAIEIGTNTFDVQGALPQKIPIESLQMANVENDAMALRDRAVVKEVRLN